MCPGLALVLKIKTATQFLVYHGFLIHSVISFVVDGIHPHDLGTLVDQDGVAIRTGHHCTQPVMQFFGVPATARASLAFYNTKEELDILAKALKKAQAVFQK